MPLWYARSSKHLEGGGDYTSCKLGKTYWKIDVVHESENLNSNARIL